MKREEVEPAERPAAGRERPGRDKKRQGKTGETRRRKAEELMSKSLALWGPRESPAKRVSWGEEEQGSGRSFRRRRKRREANFATTMLAGLHFGKPLETMGRKVLEAVESKGVSREPFGAMPVRLRRSKPRETVGQQSYGA